jgi:glycosyltransferase involved in cell wall biosynthesis
MRALFLTDSLSDLDGVGRYAVRLISALEELRPDLAVEVLLARKHRPTSSQVPAHWKVRVALPPDYFFYMDRARFASSLTLATWRTWRAARRADLVHAIKDYPHSLVGLLGARLAGVPCVATGHGTYTVQPLVSKRHARLARWTYARFAGMIAVSSYTNRRLFEELGDGVLDRRRVRVVPNCVDAAHYRGQRALGDRPWSQVPFTLGIGEIKERKGHHLALAAWCRVARERPELQHFVVGKLSEDSYLAGLRRMLDAAGVAGRVHFLGNVTEDEKIDLLQRARVFVHTPVTAADGGFEGFGIVYLEASACGTPCIGTRDSGAEEAIEDGVTGRLVAQDTDAVAAALREILDDPERRAAMGRAGIARAERSSWEGNARQVLALYDEVLAC